MFSPSEAREFKEHVEEAKCDLPMMGDDALDVVAMLVSYAFERNGALTPEIESLVDEYKRSRPHFARRMDMFVSSRGTSQP